ncbi:hypothetical protein AGLY_015776 [Aphis glycines]|uniref:CCHC-type domain-containing protein n=1 Tax=Aphis glycines TaxID=307491 RepID=A0A6G0T0G1_APHGL|nr:hypothetical protein AGLY_015776 [Aphis glycines]
MILIGRGSSIVVMAIITHNIFLKLVSYMALINLWLKETPSGSGFRTSSNALKIMFVKTNRIFFLFLQNIMQLVNDYRKVPKAIDITAFYIYSLIGASRVINFFFFLISIFMNFKLWFKYIPNYAQIDLIPTFYPCIYFYFLRKFNSIVITTVFLDSPRAEFEFMMLLFTIPIDPDNSSSTSDSELLQINPTNISDDMDNTNSASQHIRNTTTFAEIASNVTLPKMNQEIVFNSINNIKQIEYVIAISKIIPAENIQFVSRIPNNRFCIFFNSQAVMENLLKTHSSIYVNEIEIPIRRLINASKRIILSNVYPTIPNQLILNALHDVGIKTSSQITHMKAGFATDQFSHILSFRRQVYINLQGSVSQLPNSITVTVENITFRIFINDDTVTCFQCHKTGHFSSQCKNIPEQFNTIDMTETDMEVTNDLSPTSNNNDPLTPNQANDKGDLTTIDQPQKHSLAELLKASSNKSVNVTSPNPAKRPAPSTTSQPPSPKSSHSSNPPLLIKPPNAPEGKTKPSKNLNGKVHKKPKVRTITSSNDSFYSNIDEGSVQLQTPQMSLSLNQFKDFFENSQGCTDLESLYTEHHSSPENIIQIITNIYPVVTIKSIKNRLTRLSKALEKVRNINVSQTFLKILQWNPNGFFSKLDEINLLPNKYCPISICLQETNFVNNKIGSLKNYTIYYKNRTNADRASGGVAIYVNSNYHSKEIIINTNLEVVAVNVLIKNPITICNLYLPNSHDFEQSDIQNIINQLPSPFILLGDFNSHSPVWGCSTLDSQGAKIEQTLFSNNDLNILNSGQAKRVSASTGHFSAIDLSFSSSTITPFIDWDVLPELSSSDHFPIIMTLNHTNSHNHYTGKKNGN